ncbi:hypothetical protein [Nonomuraea deserti]|uniref:hypothetical protein n=1 Tax=Nonomuraea deserti TaxID=1848322 RepID=UPI0015F2BC93|nr:hypothetical protein [Nonomuraea deserti]
MRWSAACRWSAGEVWRPWPSYSLAASKSSKPSLAWDCPYSAIALANQSLWPAQLLQQTTLTSQLQPFAAGSIHQHRDQLLVRHRAIRLGRQFVHGQDSTAVSGIKCLFLDHQIRRWFHSPGSASHQALRQAGSLNRS